MNIRSYIRKINVKSMAVIACTSMLYACDSLIYDDEGDCSVNYRVKFRYDYNMKFADAFAHEVDVVTARWFGNVPNRENPLRLMIMP